MTIYQNMQNEVIIRCTKYGAKAYNSRHFKSTVYMYDLCRDLDKNDRNE